METTHIDRQIRELKKQIIIPFYLAKEDLDAMFAQMISEMDTYSQTPFFSLLVVYANTTNEDRNVLLQDIIRFLSVKDNEMDKEIYWAPYIDALLYELETFNQVMRNSKLDRLLKKQPEYGLSEITNVQ